MIPPNRRMVGRSINRSGTTSIKVAHGSPALAAASIYPPRRVGLEAPPKVDLPTDQQQESHDGHAPLRRYRHGPPKYHRGAKVVMTVPAAVAQACGTDVLEQATQCLAQSLQLRSSAHAPCGKQQTPRTAKYWYPPPNAPVDRAAIVVITQRMGRRVGAGVVGFNTFV